MFYTHPIYRDIVSSPMKEQFRDEQFCRDVVHALTNFRWYKYGSYSDDYTEMVHTMLQASTVGAEVMSRLLTVKFIVNIFKELHPTLSSLSWYKGYIDIDDQPLSEEVTNSLYKLGWKYI